MTYFDIKSLSGKPAKSMTNWLKQRGNGDMATGISNFYSDGFEMGVAGASVVIVAGYLALRYFRQLNVSYVKRVFQSLSTKDDESVQSESGAETNAELESDTPLNQEDSL